MKLKSLLKEESKKIDWIMDRKTNIPKIGKLYAVFANDYEPHTFLLLKSLNELEDAKKDYGSHSEYIGVVKCIKE